jgi:hypothetical protein
MFGKMVEAASLQGKSSRQLLFVGALAGMSLISLSPAFGGTATLFTTQSDFTGWGADISGLTVAPSATWDYDGSTKNGDANSAPGGTSAAGSLKITPPASIGFGNIVDIGESTNSLFLGDLDPGSTAVSYPPPNFSQVNGASTNYSGILTLAYTIPSNVTGSYFELGIGLNYDGHGYNPFFGTNSFTSVDGLTTAVETIPYTISAGSLSYFDFQIFSNTDYTSAAPFYVDDIQVSVPEPASMSVLGGGLVMLTLRRRRQSASSV